MNATALQICKQVDHQRRDGEFTQALREQVGRYARQRHAEGLSWKSIAKETHLSHSTVRIWAQVVQRAPQFVPVVISDAEVTPPPQDHALALVSPSGFRLEGLSFNQAAQLLGLL